MKNNSQSRRDMLRKTAMFAIPTIVSFQLSEVAVQASHSVSVDPADDFTSNNWNNRNRWKHRNKWQNGNNGNHYGNKKTDQNDKDSSKWNGNNNPFGR